MEAQYGRYVVALVSAGLNPYDVNGYNYVELLRSYCRSYCDPSGEIGKKNYIWEDCWVIMGLISSGNLSRLDASINHLKSLQTPSGGWAWNGGSDMADVDTTALVLCTLMAGGEVKNSTAIQNGLQYLRSEQNENGGFSLLGAVLDNFFKIASQDVDSDLFFTHSRNRLPLADFYDLSNTALLGSNAASDGWAIMALNAAGEDQGSGAWIAQTPSTTSKASKRMTDPYGGRKTSRACHLSGMHMRLLRLLEGPYHQWFMDNSPHTR